MLAQEELIGGDPERLRLAGASTSGARPRSATPRAPRASRRACSTATAPPCCTRSPAAEGRLQHRRGRRGDAGGADVPRQRLGHPLRAPAWRAPRWCCRAEARPGASLIAAVRGGAASTFSAGVPTIWIGAAALAASRPRRARFADAAAAGRAAARPAAALINAGFAEGIRACDILHAWGMTETSPLGTTNAASRRTRPGDGDRFLDYALKQGRAAVRRRDPRRWTPRAADLPQDGVAFGELRDARPLDRQRLLQPRRGDPACTDGRLVPHRRRRDGGRAGLHRDRRPRQGRHQVGRRVDLLHHAGEPRHGPPGGAGGGRDRRAAPEVGRAAAAAGGAEARHQPDRRGASWRFYEGKVAKWWIAGRGGVRGRACRTPPPASCGRRT